MTEAEKLAYAIAVQQMYNKGKTLREIADFLGLSTHFVVKYLNK